MCALLNKTFPSFKINVKRLNRLCYVLNNIFILYFLEYATELHKFLLLNTTYYSVIVFNFHHRVQWGYANGVTVQLVCGQSEIDLH